MCGLIGFVLRNTQGRRSFADKRNFMDQGLYASAMRGWDATGIAAIRTPGGTPLVYKKAMPSCDFLFMRKTQKMLDDIDDYHALLGHTRSATMKGHSQDQNAHPFQFGHITLTHNGHVHNWKQLGAECDLEVDSAHVAASMAQKGEEETLTRIQGDYALVWHNAQDKTINFARNHGRPLYYAEIPEWNGLVYGSEYEMMGAILSRNRIGIKEKFWYPQENVHFKWNLETWGKSSVPFLRTIDRARAGPLTAVTGTGSTERSTRTEDQLPTTSDLNGHDFLSENTELVQAVEKTNRGKKSKHANSGRPGSVRGEDKAREKLRTVGLKYDMVIGCDPVKFVPYRDGNKLGMAIVKLAGTKNKGMLAEIQNISKDTFDAIFDHGRYVLTRVVNLKVYDEIKVPVLELDETFLDRALEDYKEESRVLSDNTLAYAGPGGRLVSRDRFLELTKHGCGHCDTVIDPKLAELVVWIGDSPICHKCAEDDEVHTSLGLQAARLN